MSRKLMLGRPPAVIVAAVVLNTLVELALLAGDLVLTGDPGWRALAYRYGAFWAGLLHGVQPLYPGQPVAMFFTYAVLHGGWLHLLVNMIALVSFGTLIVERVGQRRFVVAYVLSALGGAACFGLLSTNPAPMVGASGALFGLLGVWVCWDYLDRRHFGDPLWVTMRAVAFLVVYNVVFFLLLSGNLAWETHLGGFVTGWLLAVHWGRGVALRQSRRRRRLHMDMSHPQND